MRVFPVFFRFILTKIKFKYTISLVLLIKKWFYLYEYFKKF